MAKALNSPLDHWNPPRLAQPDYFDTVKYVYKHLDFHISEDQAYTILNAFIEKWDECKGKEIRDEELKTFVLNKLLDNFEVMLPSGKINRVVELILGYLYETGHFFSK